MEESKSPQVPALVPLMTKERFSDLSGLSLDTIEGQLRRGYLPSRKVGRHRMINVALLQRECLDDEEWS
ncbi:DNA-binding protein [Salinicola avicenniae]|uniref:DNA-binding protein n=1 Tax=Salinicola avicenniae TaxID=2916836 RepID=UPI002073B55B|nr:MULTISPECIES: DNA-binding protein [unclassified Salinicola]